MIEILSNIVSHLTNPANLLVLALAVGLLLFRLGPWRRFGVRLATVATAILLAIAVMPIPQWLLSPLENRFATPAMVTPDRVDGILVLGGAEQTVLTTDRNQPALNDSAERLVAFVKLAREHPTARLAFSGGGSPLKDGRDNVAVTARQVFEDLGLDPGRVLFEAESGNTFRGLESSHALLAPKPGETWLLVTSARHMPRAVGAARKTGWTVLPYPVDFLTEQNEPFRLTYRVENQLFLMSYAVKEWIGLLGYRLLDRSDELFPGPRPASGGA